MCHYYDLHFAEEIHKSLLAKQKIRQKLSHTYKLAILCYIPIQLHYVSGLKVETGSASLT